MTSESSHSSAHTAPLVDDPIATVVTFVDFAASTVETPRPASTTLDVARHHAFTGEIRFATEPGVRMFLDGGIVYHAERDGDASVSRVLLDAGVIDAGQLERGVISVGDVEHLGRLFDRDDSIDRDAVMVMVEYRTEEIVNELADHAVTTVTVSAYRHHPSGIHRWFVAPIGRAANQRPVGGVGQVDRSVVDEMPRLGGVDEIQIEWSEPDPSGLGVPTTPLATMASADLDVQAELDRFDADQADWAAAAPAFLTPSGDAVDSPIGEFHIVWPDGTKDEALVSGPDSDVTTAHDIAPVSKSGDDHDPSTGRSRSETGSGSHPTPDTVAPVVVENLPPPGAAVPNDVEEAVRRALEAMGHAAVAQARLSTATPITASPHVAAPSTAPPEPVGFAPPTLDMRAEVVYERAAAAQAKPIGAVHERDESSDHGKASVVFVDDDDANDDAGKRRGALRRLIGSLRGKG